MEASLWEEIGAGRTVREWLAEMGWCAEDPVGEGIDIKRDAILYHTDIMNLTPRGRHVGRGGAKGFLGKKTNGDREGGLGALSRGESYDYAHRITGGRLNKKNRGQDFAPQGNETRPKAFEKRRWGQRQGLDSDRFRL